MSQRWRFSARCDTHRFPRSSSIARRKMGVLAGSSICLPITSFNLMPAKLRQHGQTLDWIFTQIPSQQVLLVDSDVELLNNAMISRMRSMLNDSQEAYGSGYLHPAHWLEYHYWSDLPLARGIGYYMARPWIPFALLRVGPVRAAFAHGRSFVHRLVMNDIPASPLLSRLLWRRFSLEFFRTHRLSYLDSFRGSYNSERPSYVSYDTGAD